MKKRFGFTLIELLVTISIISVLTAIGLANFAVSQKRARDARRQADLESVRSALEIYRADNLATGYPNTTYAGLSATLIPNYILYISFFPFLRINSYNEDCVISFLKHNFKIIH